MSDISALVKSCLLILGIAISTGYFQHVQQWAILEVAKSLKTSNTPYFFTGYSGPKTHGTSPHFHRR